MVGPSDSPHFSSNELPKKVRSGVSYPATKLTTSKSVSGDLTSLPNREDKLDGNPKNDSVERASEKDEQDLNTTKENSFADGLKSSNEICVPDRNIKIRQPPQARQKDADVKSYRSGRNVKEFYHSRRSKSIGNLYSTPAKITICPNFNRVSGNLNKESESKSSNLTFSKGLESRSSVRELAKKLECSLSKLPANTPPYQFASEKSPFLSTHRKNVQVSCDSKGIVSTTVTENHPTKCNATFNPAKGSGRSVVVSNVSAAVSCKKFSRFAESRKLPLYSNVYSADNSCADVGNFGVTDVSVGDIGAMHKKCHSTPNLAPQFVRKKKKPCEPNCRMSCNKSNSSNIHGIELGVDRDKTVEERTKELESQRMRLMNKLMKLKQKQPEMSNSPFLSQSLDRSWKSQSSHRGKNLSSGPSCSINRKPEACNILLNEPPRITSLPQSALAEISPMVFCQQSEKDFFEIECHSPGTFPRTKTKAPESSSPKKTNIIKKMNSSLMRMSRSSSFKCSEVVQNFRSVPEKRLDEKTNHESNCHLRNRQNDSTLISENHHSNEAGYKVAATARASSPNFDYRRFLLEKVLGNSPPLGSQRKYTSEI